MLTSRVDRLLGEVRRLAPVGAGGVAVYATSPAAPSWRRVSNASTGEVVLIDYSPEATAAQMTAGDDAATNFALTLGTRQSRPLWAIRADVQALTTAQFNATWADLSAAAPPVPRKYLGDVGPNAASLFVFDHVLYVIGG